MILSATTGGFMGDVATKIAQWLIARIDFDRVSKMLKPVIWVLLSCSFAITGILAYSIWADLGRTEKLMSVAMLSKLENMPETYKALSAVLTAGLDETLQERDISPKTRTFFETIKDHKTSRDIGKEVASRCRGLAFCRDIKKGRQPVKIALICPTLS
jgi:hypothetical protein